MSAPTLRARRTIDTWVRSGLPPARSIFSLADFQRWYTPARTTAKMNYPAVCAAYNKANLIYFKRRRAPAKATTCLSYKHVNSVHVLLLVQRRRKIITLSGTRRCSRFAAEKSVKSLGAGQVRLFHNNWHWKMHEAPVLTHRRNTSDWLCECAPMRGHFNEKNRRILLCTSQVTAGLIIGRAFCATHLEFHFAERRVYLCAAITPRRVFVLFKLHGNFLLPSYYCVTFYILHANAVNLWNAAIGYWFRAKPLYGNNSRHGETLLIFAVNAITIFIFVWDLNKIHYSASHLWISMAAFLHTELSSGMKCHLKKMEK